ncbi:PASTA domain-containing protein [Micromonospora sp. NIE79]|uniref:PASTA domain-containing protein n=1 Tax=Micromonospora trifolii TaxID=2911208 RepID=A0ABS9MX54_9ACTN|nr:PASTA domain-containing protein [Micromonospora trifolii]MCG5442178.1 PASTA domain-containing protein [Micromonospora trifolii]
MSDDRQEPPAGEHDDDRTRPLPPAADRPEPTQPAPAAADPDETAPIDGTVPARPDLSPDQTMPIDRSAGTRPGPPADRTAPIPPSWSGRAEVRSPRPDDAGGEWYVEEQGGRRWWSPILWGVLALLLAGLLGGALWLVLAQQDDRDDRGPTPSPSPTSAPSAPPTSAAPTSAAPTSESPSSSPTTEAPEEVPVPPIVGLPQATAEGLLTRLGLPYRVVYRPSELPPGTVVGTEPEAGTSVSTDDEVLLIISQAQPSTGASPTTPSPTVTSTS